MTFLGMPAADPRPGDVAILGVPIGVPYPGRAQGPDSQDGPAAIRGASQRFARFVGNHDFDLRGPLLGGTDLRGVDAGDVTAENGDPGATAARTTHAVRSLLAAGGVPVILGGDDSVPIPVLRAYEGFGTLIVVQVDAHLDFRDEVDGVREGYSSPMRRASEMPWVERIVQVGLRGVGSARSADVADAEAAGNVLITAREVHEHGIETVFDQLPDSARYFISLDLDGLDPAVAPGVNAPLPGGLTFDEVASLLRGLAARGRIAGMALTELVPARDVNELSALTAVRLVWALIGAIARSPVP